MAKNRGETQPEIVAKPLLSRYAHIGLVCADVTSIAAAGIGGRWIVERPGFTALVGIVRGNCIALTLVEGRTGGLKRDRHGRAAVVLQAGRIEERVGVAQVAG